MANLSQTAANVAIGSRETRTLIVQAGEAITQGMPVYLSTSDGKYYQSDANASATAAQCDGIALTPAATDGYLVIALPGSGAKVNLGATLTVGQIYAVSATKGAICPVADLTTGDYPTIIGPATTAALLAFDVIEAGVAKP
jgi:hypothetical protein